MDVGATLVDYAQGELPPGSQARSLRPLVEGRGDVSREFAVSEFRGHTAILDRRFKTELGPDGNPTLLFDRLADPGEQVNLVDDPRCAGVLAEARQRLQRFRDRTPPARVTLGD
jgi:arylsulfatase A-like enzyme